MGVMEKLLNEATLESLTTCALSLVVGGAVAYMAIHQIEPKEWFLMIASGVFSAHFTLTRMRK